MKSLIGMLAMKLFKMCWREKWMEKIQFIKQNTFLFQHCIYILDEKNKSEFTKELALFQQSALERVSSPGVTCITICKGATKITGFCTVSGKMNSLACEINIKSVDTNNKNNTKEGTRLYILLNRVVIVKRAYTVYWKENNTDK